MARKLKFFLPFWPINLTLVQSGVESSSLTSFVTFEIESSLIVSTLVDSFSPSIDNFVCNDVGSSVSNVAVPIKNRFFS